MVNPYQLLLICSIIFFMMPGTSLIAQRTKSSINAGEQRFSEKGLKDNRYFFYFINSSISNFGNDENKIIFKKAIQRDIISQILYMKFLFHDSYIEIRKAQEILIDLYKNIIQNEILNTKKLLDDAAPDVIKSNKFIGKHYLELGYKSLVTSKQFMITGDNIRDSLFSMRLNQYVKAIKKAKLGKRYAMMSMIFTKLEKELFVKDYKSYNFEEIEKLIKKTDSETKKLLLSIHYDNYYKVIDKMSFYDKIWIKPDLNEINEYKEYLDKK